MENLMQRINYHIHVTTFSRSKHSTPPLPYKLVLIIFLLVGILHEIRMHLFLKRKRCPIKTRISNKDFNNKSL